MSEVHTAPEVILVTGDRYWSNSDVIVDKLGVYPKGSTLRHGAATGADSIAQQAGKLLGFEDDPIPYKGNLGLAGGPVRNREMANKAPRPTVCLAFHDDIQNSKGTKDMLSVCMKMGIPFKLFNSSGQEVPVTPEMLQKPKKPKNPKKPKV